MPKSEYYEPKLLEGEKEQPSIPVDLDKLLELWLRALPMMTAVDRKRYGDRVVDSLLDAVGDFHLAYDFQDFRLEHLRKMCASIAKYVHLSRVVGEVNAISIPLKHETMTPNQMRLAIFEHTASLEEGATKWRNTITRGRGKGTTASAGRTAGKPKEKGGGTIPGGDS